MGGVVKKFAIIAVHGAVGWAFCGALMGVGMAVTSMDRTLVIHAVGAPLGFAVVAWFYFRRFGFTSPLVTAALFLATVIVLDIVVVALLIEKSFAMFRSPLGTWIPFALIFLSTYLTGRLTSRAAGGV